MAQLKTRVKKRQMQCFLKKNPEEGGPVKRNYNERIRELVEAIEGETCEVCLDVLIPKLRSKRQNRGATPDSQPLEVDEKTRLFIDSSISFIASAM